jgi:hypothetical protein
MFGVRLTCLCYKPTSRHLLSLSSMCMDGDVPFIHVLQFLNDVSSTPRHERDSNSQVLVVIGIDRGPKDILYKARFYTPIKLQKNAFNSYNYI